MNSASERSQAKRAAILAAAAELITEHGYDGTSLDAVVERAACSKSAVYELFGNKEGVLSALTEDIALELTRALEAFDREGAACTSRRIAIADITDVDPHTRDVRAALGALGWCD
jgi:AcrR family transcriptional regulator